jgi:hypothetical protein
MITPEQLQYEETMRKALIAQVNLAPSLYKAEADPITGRKAYADLDMQIAEQTLHGKSSEVDADGYVELKGVSFNPQNFQQFATEDEVAIAVAKTLGDRAYQIVKNGASDATGGYKDGSPFDVGRHGEWGESFDRNLGDKRVPAFSPRGRLAEYISQNQLGQKPIDDFYNIEVGIGDDKPFYSKDNVLIQGDPSADTYKEYVGKDKAGTLHKSGGVLGILGGTGEKSFIGEDGQVETRKAGYSKDGEFLGTAKFEQDILEHAKTQQIKTEVSLADQYGKDLTTAYRGSGDIQGALDKVKDLQQYESAITDGVETGGKSLFNLANQFTAPQIKSPYSSGGNQAQEQQQYTDPSDLGNPSGMSDGEKKLEANNRANFDSIQERYDQTLQDIDDGFGWTTKEKALEKYNQEMAQFKAEQPENFYKYSNENNLKQGTRGLADKLQQGEEVQQDAMLTNWEQRQGATTLTGGQPSMSQSGDLTQNRGVSALSAGGLATDGNVNTKGLIESATFDPLAIDSVNPTGTIGKASQGTGSIRDVVDGKNIIPTVDDRGSVERASQGSSAIRSVGLSGGIRDASQGTSAIRDVSLTGGIRDASQGNLEGTNFNASNTQGDISSNALGDMGGLRSALSASGLQALNDGGDLSARELRNIQQDARSASTARGRSRDMSAIMSEVQNSAGARRQRLNENRAFAQGALGQEGAFRQDEAGRGQQVDLANMQRGMAYDQRADSLTSQSNALLGDQQARSLQASMANQQADLAGRSQGLQADLANQQVDLSNRDRSLQSSIANQQADLSGRGQGLQAQVVNQQSDISNRERQLQASIANQQGDLARMNTDLQSQLANQGVAVGNRERQLQANLANQQSDITQRNLDLQESTTNLNRDLSVQNNKLQSDLANQQTQMGIQDMNLQASSANQGADINLMNANLQADLANQQNLTNFRNREFQANLTNQRTQMELLTLEQQAQAGNAQAIQQLQALTFQGLNKDYDRDIALQQWNQQNYQQALGMERGFSQSRVGLEQATSADGLLAVTGRGSGAGVGSGQGVYGNSAVGLSSAPQLYNMAQGAQFMADQTAGANNFMANMYASEQQASAGIISGLAQGVGSAIGCWVAREIYGETNPQWLLFREYLFTDAPSWFRKLYLKFGERFAEFIANKPRLKSIIKKWMDSKIKGGK